MKKSHQYVTWKNLLNLYKQKKKGVLEEVLSWMTIHLRGEKKNNGCTSFMKMSACEKKEPFNSLKISMLKQSRPAVLNQYVTEIKFWYIFSFISQEKAHGTWQKPNISIRSYTLTSSSDSVPYIWLSGYLSHSQNFFVSLPLTATPSILFVRLRNHISNLNNQIISMKSRPWI